MKSTELEILIANCIKDNSLDIDEFTGIPSVGIKDNLPKDAEPGYFTMTDSDGMYYLYSGTEWLEVGKCQDQEVQGKMEQMQTDIASLKLSTGTPVDLSEYVKKEEIDQVVTPLTAYDIQQILEGE